MTGCVDDLDPHLGADALASPQWQQPTSRAEALARRLPLAVRSVDYPTLFSRAPRRVKSALGGWSRARRRENGLEDPVFRFSGAVRLEILADTRCSATFIS
jgi:hypothetical protein